MTEKENKTGTSSSKAYARVVENATTEHLIAGENKTKINYKAASTENTTTAERRATWWFIFGRKLKKRKIAWKIFLWVLYSVENYLKVATSKGLKNGWEKAVYHFTPH